MKLMQEKYFMNILAFNVSLTKTISKKLKLKTYFGLSFFLLFTFGTLPVFSLPPDPTPCYDFPRKEHYGNAQTCRFKRSIFGGYLLTPEEEAALIEQLFEKEAGRYYGRLGFNASLYTLNRLSSKSGTDVNGLPIGAGILQTTRATRSGVGAEVAFGYFMDSSSRVELEYLYNPTQSYTTYVNYYGTNPAGNPIATVSNRITSSTLLVNFYLEYKYFERLRPFVMAGLGGSVIDLRTTTSSYGTSNPSLGFFSKNIGGIAFTLGVGLRVRVFSHWSLNLTYRYTNLGRTVIMSNYAPINNQGLTKLEGTYSQTGASLGFIYLF